MDYLSGYASSGDEADSATNTASSISKATSETTTKPSVGLPNLNIAPVVTHVGQANAYYFDRNQKEADFNPRFQDLYATEYGPTHPDTRRRNVTHSKSRNAAGTAEATEITDFTFREQFHSFETTGIAADPAFSQGITGGVVRRTQKRVNNRKHAHPQGPPEALEAKEEEDGPAKKKTKTEDGEEEEEVDEGDKNKRKGTETTIFHGKDFYDYKGRTFMQAPSDLHVPATAPKAFLPKKIIHTWSGHTKGVNAVRFFPGTSHLLLSAGLDGKAKIWETYGQRRCIRTYVGHDKGIRDIDFNNDGSRFLTAAYDRKIKLWDTETGQCIQDFGTGRIPYCVKFNPDKPNEFMSGMQDKKIVQWDTNTKEIVQEYDRHLGPVNSITFIDNNKRFVTTSDDKSIRLWEYGIPVDYKLISDPTMHSMPAVCMHPSKKSMLMQSQDNKIMVYGCRDRFRINRKKIFGGHLTAGYACQVSCSPDGRFVTSGDGDGRVFIWDWKNKKILKTLKAHKGVCIGVLWNPNETSRLVTCGWDGAIHYWD